MTQQQGIRRPRFDLPSLFRQYILLPFQQAQRAFPWFGVVMSVLFAALFINILSQTLFEWGGLTFAWGILLSAGVLILVFVLVYHWNANRQPGSQSYSPIDIPNPAQHRGLIALFANEQTLGEAVRYHTPVLTNCWLVVTPQLTARAEIMHDHLEAQGIHVDIRPLSMLYDTKGCYEIVRNVFEHETIACGLRKQDIIADITSGTKPMTMGMVLACLEQGADIEHVPTEYDAEGKPRGPQPPIQIDVPGRSAEGA